jgi:hypothetical protein
MGQAPSPTLLPINSRPVQIITCTPSPARILFQNPESEIILDMKEVGIIMES